MGHAAYFGALEASDPLFQFSQPSKLKLFTCKCLTRLILGFILFARTEAAIVTNVCFAFQLDNPELGTRRSHVWLISWCLPIGESTTKETLWVSRSGALESLTVQLCRQVPTVPKHIALDLGNFVPSCYFGKQA